MPYKQGSGAQENSALPAVSDIYYSSNVYVNNVAVGLWQTAGQSAAFANDISATPSLVLVAAAEAAEGLTSVAMPATAVSANAIESLYQGTAPQAITTTTAQLSTATTSDLGTWMQARLGEANNGMWSRENPPQPEAIEYTPGNANIVGIWTSLGITTAPFTTDQPAWCMGFVNFGLKQCGYYWCPEASAQAMATNSSRWNATQVTSTTAQTGDIAVWNYGGHYHVNFVYTANNGTLTFVGGNQNSTNTSSNNPSSSTVSQAWPSGWTQANSNSTNGILVGIWRPTK